MNWKNYGKNTALCLAIIVLTIGPIGAFMPEIGGVLYVLWLAFCFAYGWVMHSFCTKKDVWGFLQRLRSSD